MGGNRTMAILYILERKFNNMEYKRFKMGVKVSVAKCYIDDELVSTATLLEGFQEIKLPQDKRLGYYIQFEVTGTGVLNEIEYKVEGRQNGK
jgi:hypothetical protein